MPEPITLTLASFAAGLIADVAKNLIGDFALAAVKDGLLDRRTNHDVQRRLQTTFHKAVDRIFDEYVRSGAFARLPEETKEFIRARWAWLKEPETAATLLPIVDSPGDISAAEAISQLYIGRQPEVNARLFEALSKAGVLDGLPGDLSSRLQQQLLNGILFFFVEDGIKRDPKVRDAMLFRQLIEARRSTGATADEISGLRLELRTALLARPEPQTFQRDVLDRLDEILVGQERLREELPGAVAEELKRVVNQYFTATEAAARPEAQARIRVLVVAPDPLGQPLSPLNIAGEWAELAALIQRSDYPAALVRLNPPTFEHLQAAVADLTNPYDVIHFIAHGDGEHLALEARDGGVDRWPYSKIAESLALSPAQIFIFGVCKSLPLALALESAFARQSAKSQISCAMIAAPDDVYDDLAEDFARGLYAGLFGRQPAGVAFEMGERLIDEQCPFVLRGDEGVRLRELSDGAGPLLFPGDPPHNDWLPGYSKKGFKGRAGELRMDFAEFFRPGGEVAALFVTGIGGIGKTTLATAAARRYGWQFPGGIVSVPAKDVPNFSSGSLVGVIDSALGTEAGKSRDPVSAALAVLNNGPHLLIVDNLESIESHQVRRDLATLISGIEAGTGSRAVLTMRPRAMDEFDELRHRELRVGPLGHDEAIAVLRDRAQLDGFRRLGGHEAELAEAAHYHPLLLALTAGWLHLAPLNEVLRWLRELRGDTLDVEIPARLGAMVTDVEKAAPGAGRVLCALAVFSGGATHEAILAVHTPPSTIHKFGSGGGVAKALVELGKGNLIELDPKTDRYTLQSLVAQWARHHGPLTREEWIAAGRTHAEHFLTFAQEHREEYRALEPELDNLRAAFAFVTDEETQDDELTRALVPAVDFFLDKRGYWNENIQWWQAYGDASQRLGDRAGLATTYNNIGLIHDARGDYRVALEWYMKDLAISEELGDRAGLAATYNNIGRIHDARGDYPAALDWYGKSIAISEKLGDRALLATNYDNIGGIDRARGDYPAALEWYQKSLAIRDELGDRAGLAASYNNIGAIHDARGDYPAALDWYGKSIAISEELGDRAGLATSYNNVGEVYRARGDYPAALEWYEKSVAIKEQLGDRAGLATSYNNIGAIHDARGDYPTALEWYQKSIATNEELGDRALLARTYNNIGLIHDAHGDYSAAVELLEKSLAILEEIGAAADAAAVRGNLEEVRRKVG